MKKISMYFLFVCLLLTGCSSDKTKQSAENRKNLTVDINKIQKELLEEDTIIDIAELFKVFADSTRVKIINVLLENKLCVSDIATLVGGTQSAISHQLRILKSAKLVKYTKIGKTVYYKLSDDHVKKLFNIGKEHINEI